MGGTRSARFFCLEPFIPGFGFKVKTKPKLSRRQVLPALSPVTGVNTPVKVLLKLLETSIGKIFQFLMNKSCGTASN
jgi:hypothetical protein